MDREKIKGPQKNVLYFPALFTVILLLLCFCSCKSGAKVREDRLHAYLTDSSRYFLLPPEGIGKSMDMAQFVSASYNGQDYFMNAWVKADETGMEMTLLNEFGVNMGELSYKNGVVKFSSPVFPKSTMGEYIVADFQLCFYDPLLLRGALKECGLAFETDGNTRRILKGKKIIIEIEKTEKAVKLINHLRGYTYTLEGDYDN